MNASRKITNALEGPVLGGYLIAVFILAEGVGLFAQHYLGLQPCANCVLIRAWLCLLLIGGIYSLTTNKMFPKKGVIKQFNVLVTYALGYVGLIKAVNLSVTNASLERGKSMFSSCSIESPFPSWMPLDSWIPEVFEPRAICGDRITFIGNLSFSEVSIIGIWAALLLLSVSVAFYRPFGDSYSKH